MISIMSRSAQETFAFGESFARLLREGDVLALSGNLGSGKTTFVRGLIAGFGLNHRVASPTFVICQEYLLPGRGTKKLYHFDLYRLKSRKELAELGFGEVVQNLANITIVEWSEKIKNKLPKRSVRIKFIHGTKPDQRMIQIYD